MNDAILSLLIGSSAGILGLLIRYSYYSKCDVIECCYCCKIHRQVVNEINDDNPEINSKDNEVSINITPPQKIMTEPKVMKLKNNIKKNIDNTNI